MTWIELGTILSTLMVAFTFITKAIQLITAIHQLILRIDQLTSQVEQHTERIARLEQGGCYYVAG